MEDKKFFTSESVMAGHPDKMCDRISDAVLDAIIEKDEQAHVACETVVTSDLVMLTGEVTAKADIEYERIIRNTIKEIGYDSNKYGFNGNDCKIIMALKQQSPDIALGVNKGDTVGAGDQGMMFGFACNETEEYMPAPIVFAHKLVKRLDDYRKEVPDVLGPDGKAQVTISYKAGKIDSVDTVVVSVQHTDTVDIEGIEDMILENVIRPAIPSRLITRDTKFYINPTGRFVEGGPNADAGLTGRKIIVDTYGGYAAHGGGAFSRKDPTKVDRTGAYMARYIAKNLVAAELAHKCQIQLAYAIGREEPVSIDVKTFGTSNFTEEQLVEIVKKEFCLTPKEMIRNLDLRRPIYKETSVYGHFGRNGSNFPWEGLAKVNDLKKYI